MSSHVTPSIKKGKKRKKHDTRCATGVDGRAERTPVARNKKKYQVNAIRILVNEPGGGLTNVTGKIARKESPVFALSTSTSRPNRFTTRARVPEPPLIHHPPVYPANRTTYHPIPSRSSSIPSQKNRQKLPFASMLLLCQHSHYVSANSKPLLYLFRVYDILYFTFFNYFFLFVNIRRAVSLPSAYCQTTYLLASASFSLFLSLSHPDLVSFNLLARAFSPRRVFPTRLSPLTFSISLSLAVYK